jgi:hypothetical protein
MHISNHFRKLGLIEITFTYDDLESLAKCDKEKLEEFCAYVQKANTYIEDCKRIRTKEILRLGD